MFLNRALDILFPPQCLICRELVAANGALCLTCWQKIRFITAPCCHRCGLPFSFEMGQEALCGPCLQEAPSYTLARAVFRYDEHSSALVTMLKYADQTQLAVTYGKWLANVAGPLLAGDDILIPVPLHYGRLVKRRYNQSALLARALSRHAGLPWLPDTLRRHRPTTAQTGLNRKQRLKNVDGAFSIPKKLQARVARKNIVLVDDVLTTGATIEHCARCLLQAGATNVNVLTLARAGGD